MKKYLPIIAVVGAAVLFVAAVFIIRKINQPVVDNSQEAEQSVPDLPEDQRPSAALVPSSDSHYLSLKVTGIKVPDAASMDYELLYKAFNGVADTTEGVPGSIQLKGQTSITRDNILLGSESSGKVRFDKNVENGTLTLRFRNAGGKLLGKVSTSFRLQTNTLNLASVDGSFKYTLNKQATGVWFVTMQPFSAPDPKLVVVYANGWAIFASDGLPHAGSVGQ